MGPGRLPLAVEPEDAQRPVAGDQLLELAFHVLDVAVHVGRARGPVVPGPALGVVRVMPVHDRMVEAELDARPRGRLPPAPSSGRAYTACS